MGSLFNQADREVMLGRVARRTPERSPIKRFAARGADAGWPPSRVFGRISGRSWGVLQHKHLDHHFRQFGV